MSRHGFNEILVIAYVLLPMACSSADSANSPPSLSLNSSYSITSQPPAVTLEQLEVGRLWEIVHAIRQPQGNDKMSETDAYNLALGETVKKCMADHGFEYVNVLWDKLRIPIDISRLGPTDRQRSAGYSISTHVEYWYRNGLYNPEANPNIAILDQLDSEEAAAWNATLTGAPGSDEPSCLQIATDNTKWNNDLSTLEVKLNLVEREVNTHPLVKDATRVWSKCMSEAEYVYDTPKDILGELQQAMVPLMLRLEALDPRPSSIDDVPIELKEVLDALVSHELDVAATDLKCRETHLNSAIRSIQRTVHERFIDDNPELLKYLEDSS